MQFIPDAADARQHFAREARVYLPALSSSPVSHTMLFHWSSACRKRFAVSSSIELDWNLKFYAAHTARSVSLGAAPNALKLVVSSKGNPNIIIRSAAQKILRHNFA